MSNNLISLTDVQLAFGHHPLLDHADLVIQKNERIGLIGRNGAGKSSLLKILDQRQAPDDGQIKRLGGLKIATVEQEPELDPEVSIYDFLCGDFTETEDWQRPARVNALMDKLGLDPDALTGSLSGGQRKRVALANALVEEPDLLLLDEPTNHLDFDGILWLEQLLLDFRGSAVIITHDRRFLDVVTTRIIELDRGKLFSFPGNFSQWQERKAEFLEAEKQQNAKFDKFLAQEEVWIRKGVQARRTRDEGRVRRLEQLRRDRAERRERSGDVKFAISEGQRSGKLVAELQGVTHGYDGRILIKDFSTVLMRGDRIGLIGHNGAGKTTLLRIMLGLQEPNSGVVRHGTKLNIGYFDQMRSRLDENATLADTISPGSEWVEIGNQRKHIMSYLEDFLFPAARAHSPVRSLSGGERARLALARMFAQPTNVLVLDEPTNDLDIETLELLEDLIQDYTGTVLLVSHDRTFLDNVVTQVIAAEGDGHWGEYVGGYDEWLAQRPQTRTETAASSAPAPAAAEKSATERNTKTAKPGRLAPWEEKELEALPEKIAAIESQQAELAEQLSAPDLYKDGSTLADEINSQLDQLNKDLEQLFERWEKLEEKRLAS
ncbi:ATP-binding cassette domain-containing protein [Alcaligenes aquatilis]|jgi:ATP-binding cassette subfamily F protein uup|uniref:ATP-binding protein Uup n=1 Tax=Alcaligenes aquatilis TaxID=323284 RepID=A0ABY4NK06_9BURK|nr:MULTISPECIES: ATP-binding cassette domain-containing protein [Alcaligenes]AWG35642.1 ABC transporter ATP-binding protein [Alcaligenes aquatilis]MCC9163816.1 ATP-binding cassette domain-containing protein [Alcaligenes sp. MMA]MCH4224953.1 ATP-binding cassette domain-containing protein [Alcaligenes faecalis]UQN36728.1 ATP-binding cassette domain-containing protein [Alcaligenes aquatilis]UYY88008.1 ATP-binding cassette domain-containing protein [Alcaligenes sp. SMD-FA]